MAFLLDTNTLSEILNKRPNKGVTDWLGRTDESSQFISAFTIGEIQKGISKLSVSRRRNELQEWFERLQNRYEPRILAFTAQSAKIWGRLLVDVERRGRPLPVIDSLIAATAVEHDLTVITRNAEDFEPAKVKVLNVWR
jgi:predicted nucleic acid-binding protein